MGFVKSPLEIERIQAALREPRFVSGQMLRVRFLTHPETVERILPPGFRPLEEPVVTAQVNRWQSNCVGNFESGSLYLSCHYGGHIGSYALCMYMSTEQAMVYGRELFGEPKKLGRATLFRRDGGFTGSVERDGMRLIELDVRADVHHGAGAASADNFNIKARPATDGDGLQEDAIVTCATFASTLRERVEGAASVRLRGTAHDPLDEIEVVSVLGGEYAEGAMAGRCRDIGRIETQAFLPYFYGRMDDWSRLNTMPHADGGLLA